MLDDEEYLDVDVFPAVYGENESCMMMAYVRGGTKYITFALQGGDGIWIPGPFPGHLIECDECLESLAENLAEEGFVLTHTPEQMARIV